MGVVILPPRRLRRQNDSGPIGSWKRPHAVAVSIIRFDDRANTFV